MSKKRQQSRRIGQLGTVPRVVTAEGDPLVIANAVFRHSDPDAIRHILSEAGDFELTTELQAVPDESVRFAWFETRPEATLLPEPLGRRVLATLTLTPDTLTVETMSRRRRRACRRRLEALLGGRIELTAFETRPMEEAAREADRRPEPEPLTLPPEVVAEFEDRMIRQWLDESIPALGGLTPREAAKTPEGRQSLRALFDYIARQQEQVQMPPGMYSPDYDKAKKLLGLE